MFFSKSLVSSIPSNSSFYFGNLIIMISTKTDFKLFNSFSKDKLITKQKIYESYLTTYINKYGYKYSFIGPFIGTPYTTMLLETLINWGINQIIFIGWSGSVSNKVQIGDIILPLGAIINDGTSCNYSYNLEQKVIVSTKLRKKIIDLFINKKINYHSGIIWTTDAIFKESIENINYLFKIKGIISIEMELAAVLSISKLKKIKTSAILITSDSIKKNVWKTGFKYKIFKQSRKSISKIINILCKNIQVKNVY